MEFQFNLKKIIQSLCYYILPAVMLILVLTFQLLNIDNYELLSEFGKYALILVLVILFAKPISVIFNKVDLFRIIMSYRREMGVLAFWFAMFHAILLMFYLKLISIENLPLITNPKGYLFWGVLALFGMFLLGITSNTLSQIKLKQKWKKLQYLAYPTLAFILIHKAIVKNEFEPYIILGIYIILKIIENYLIKKRLNSIPTNNSQNLNSN